MFGLKNRNGRIASNGCCSSMLSLDKILDFRPSQEETLENYGKLRK
jgi:hypothetical protein